jgi:excisionase family DNA binding protein
MSLPASVILKPAESEITADTSDLLTVKDVAEILRVPVSWVYGRTRKRSLDRLPGMRLGKYWRYRREDIAAWLRRQQP